jgi:hypothetical protein
MIALETGATRAAIVRVPAKPDALADLEMRHVRTDCADSANHLVAWHEGILRYAPIIIEHAQVTMANAAVLDVNFDLARGKRTRVVFKRFKFSSWSGSGVSFDHNKYRWFGLTRSVEITETRTTVKNTR